MPELLYFIHRKALSGLINVSTGELMRDIQGPPRKGEAFPLTAVKSLNLVCVSILMSEFIKYAQRVGPFQGYHSNNLIGKSHHRAMGLLHPAWSLIWADSTYLLD